MSDSDHKLAVAQLFSGLGSTELDELFQVARIQLFERDAVVFRDGDPGSELFVVLEGRVRISLRLSGAKEETLGFLGAGESFGEMAALGEGADAQRSATATAEGHCSVLVIEGRALRSLMEENRELGFVVLRNLVFKLSGALRASNDKVTLLAESASF